MEVIFLYYKFCLVFSETGSVRVLTVTAAKSKNTNKKNNDEEEGKHGRSWDSAVFLEN